MLADSGRERQVDAERGAMRDRAADIDRAAVAGDEFAGDGQAKAGPFLLAREVGLENLTDVFGRDTGTVVRHGDLDQWLLRIEGLRAEGPFGGQGGSSH